tara:strand:- start:20 stop:559 length:540 start_codon:yes stop_codon:yes gene_type:complete
MKKYSYKTSLSFAKMIQGKIIQEAIFFALSNQSKNISQKKVFEYAKNRYLILGNKIHKQSLKKMEKFNNSLIRTGIHFLQSIKALNCINPHPVIFEDQHVYPDFFFKSLNFDNKKLKNCYVELKITNNFTKSKLSRDIAQASKYLHGRNNSFLFYLIIENSRKITKLNIVTKLYKLKKY